MPVQIQLRNGTAAQWTAANPTLAAGEVGIESDTKKQKFGDGTTAWNSLAYAGTVTSVTGTSPVASSGGATPAISLSASYGDTQNPYASKTANQVLAAPNGSAGVPSFRALVSSDIPTLNQNTTGTAAGLSSTLAVSSGGTGQTTYTDGQLLIGNSTGNTLTKATLTAGTNVTITNSAGGITIAASGGGGGVTSVTGTSPVASSGGTTPAISLSTAYGDTLNPYASKTANYILAAPNGTAGVPTFRAIVAADIPTLNQNTTGSAASLSSTLAVASGGTGLTTTPANGALDIGNGTGFTRTTLTAGTNVTITNSAGGITIAAAGGSGSPGGSTTQVQYNNAGAFGGISGFTTDGTRVTASTTIGVGGATPSTSGVGITFPSAESLSTNVNTLDDYEEGTWTPVVKGDGTAGTYELQSNLSTYTKVGNLVSLNCQVRLAATITGGGTGILIITGLPFSKGASQVGFGATLFSGPTFPALVLYVSAEFYSSGSSATLFFDGIKSAASSAAVQISGVAANNFIGFSITYQT